MKYLPLFVLIGMLLVGCSFGVSQEEIDELATSRFCREQTLLYKEVIMVTSERECGHSYKCFESELNKFKANCWEKTREKLKNLDSK